MSASRMPALTSTGSSFRAKLGLTVSGGNDAPGDAASTSSPSSATATLTSVAGNVRKSLTRALSSVNKLPQVMSDSQKFDFSPKSSSSAALELSQAQVTAQLEAADKARMESGTGALVGEVVWVPNEDGTGQRALVRRDTSFKSPPPPPLPTQAVATAQDALPISAKKKTRAKALSSAAPPASSSTGTVAQEAQRIILEAVEIQLRGMQSLEASLAREGELERLQRKQSGADESNFL